MVTDQQVRRLRRLNLGGLPKERSRRHRRQSGKAICR
jgi:hypothetical protein